eukprot:TRINITY_DN84951_c0_g1_i1.p1 TRINITY_DN84951_c0_g1~~TRINITY_DN84951_c0_g1_i1.p1  ORF type:complete len:263 (-),score=12.08 TRINITY_DN84951_c0_g1_i1:201-989(-)
MSIVPKNALKALLRSGGNALGTMVAEMKQPSVFSVLKNANFDYAIIDNEHGMFTTETLITMSGAAKNVGVTPIVRIPQNYRHWICQSLDAGAQGVMVPLIRTPAEVEEIVSYVKFPPVGARGNAQSRAWCDYKTGNVQQAMDDANNESLVVIQIETVEAMENLDAIAKVPGVDVLFVGPNDLSIALGVAGEMTNPKLVEAIDKVVAACDANKIWPALQMNDPALAKHWAQKGMRILSTGSDVGFLTAGAKIFSKAVAEGRGQ